jgi:serine/threonine-protein kinase
MVTDRLTGLKINDRYEILSKLASGGMADVYLGYDKKQAKKVAIKILHENYSSNRNFIARFKSEAKILTRLSNPNIVGIYEWGEFNDLYFIVMEYVSGESLKKIIEKNGSLGALLTASYAIQICNALQEAHSNNLVHRDIKPQNIMITEEGRVKLTDFGIAKTVTDDITKTMGILGTAHYVSPEQAQGKILDYRSDIYSLGIVMYEMLCGDIPFRGGSSIDISLRHISENPQPISILAPGISPKIEKIVMKCLQKNPTLRYSSASELKKDLENFLEGRMLSFEKEELDSKTGLSRQRHQRFLKNKSGAASLKMPYNQDETSYPENFSQADKSYSRQYKKFSRLRNFLVGLAALFAVLFFIFLPLYLANNTKLENLRTDSGYLLVPPIINIRAQQAKDILSTYGLSLKITGAESSDTVEKDFIISQLPQKGSKVAVGSIINVVVSSGAKEISAAVPNLTGMDKASAMKMIEKEGFTGGTIIEEFNDFYMPGIIISQVPEGGYVYPLDTKIDIVISKGTEFVTVPDLTGYDYVYSITSLEALGFNVMVLKESSGAYPPGTALGTNPVAGTPLKKNDIVKLIISVSDELIPIPDMVSMEYARAQGLLETMGIIYEISYIKVDYSIQKDSVIAQFPEAGTNIFPAEKVILFVGN